MTITATLCFLIRGGEVLLGLKKRRIGAGKRNGIGGRQESGESIEDCAMRELQEESGIQTAKKHLQKFACINFFNEIQRIDVHVFLVPTWQGEPQPTDEMADYRWYHKDQLPFDEMMPADKHWLPLILAGQKITARVHYNADQSALLGFEWAAVEKGPE